MLERYYTINEATGVSLTLLQDGNITIDVCGVAVDRNKLTITKKLTDITSIEALRKEIQPKSTIALNLSGKGVLQKQIEKTEDIDQTNFSKILPNGTIDDFYIQNFISGEFSFVSVVRKAEADKWLGKLKALGFVPAILSLGPYPVQYIIPQLNVYDSDLVFNGYTIKRNDRMEWISSQYNDSDLSPFPLKVESENIHEKLLIPYAAAFQLVLADKVEPIRADVPSLEEALNNRIADKKVKVHGVVILCVLFTLLLINIVLFSWLSADNAKLAYQVSRTAQNTEDVNTITEQVQKKEALLNTLGWEGGINKSALIDQVAALLPPEVTWKEAAVDPINTAGNQAQKAISFFYRRIRITGSSEKIVPVNEWIARIKTKSWVKNVQLDSFTFNDELNTGQYILFIEY